MTTAAEETIAVHFDLEPGSTNLWAVAGAMPCERALLDAWVLCLGLKDRLSLAAAGFPLSGDLARAYTFSATSAQALLDASLPAYVGHRTVTLLILEATKSLERIIEELATAEEASWSAIEGEVAADLAQHAKTAADAALEARDVVQKGTAGAGGAVEQIGTLRSAA